MKFCLKMLSIFPLGIWFFGAQNTYHFIVRELKNTFFMPFSWLPKWFPQWANVSWHVYKKLQKQSPLKNHETLTTKGEVVKPYGQPDHKYIFLQVPQGKPVPTTSDFISENFKMGGRGVFSIQKIILHICRCIFTV